METQLQDFQSIVLKLASPEQILSWSYGEITKPETINYRTGRPERDGLFDERIFGPTKDWECYCGKYRRIRYKGIICDKCGVEVTRAIVRRERMGHIKLASPVSHIWFLRGVPSKLGLILDLSINDLEKIIYFAGYIITSVDEEARNLAREEIEREFKIKSKAEEAGGKEGEISLKEAKAKALDDLMSLKLHSVLSEVEYHRMSQKFGEVFEAEIGSEALYKILSSLDFKALKVKLEEEFNRESPLAQRKTLKRLEVINGMLRSGIRPEWMFLTILPVIPPDLRPMVQLDGGRYATSDLNDLYRRVINRNNRLKRLYELNAPEVITRNEKRMLQEAVDALIDNSIRRGGTPVASQVQRRPLKSLADILKGKQGRFRQNLLGKRVDYSGRSVIVVGPELALGECGIPKKMALELFKPFVIRRLIERELTFNIRGAGKLIEDQHPVVWEALEEVIKGRLLLLNRAPTLHRLGIQAFQPVLIEGDAIQIHPLVCPAFNADFDGDQMAVHLPLTDEAQSEAREIMLSTHNLLKPATGDPIINPTKDIVFGCYFATSLQDGLKGEGKIFGSSEEAILAYDSGKIALRSKIKVRIDKALPEGETGIIETSAGRLLFNRALPDDFPYINKQIKHGDLVEIVNEAIHRYGISGTPAVLDALKNFGFEYATKSGLSWGMTDLVIPQGKTALVSQAKAEVAAIFEQYQRGLLTDKERYDRVLEVWQGVERKITELVPQALDRDGSIYSMVDSKARGSWTQIRQMSGMKGRVVNPAGKTIELPVISSYKEGLNVLEYFIATHGARKGTADTALRTSAAGYLTRRLAEVAQNLVITEKNCKAKEGLKITRLESEEINKSLGQRAFSRMIFEDLKDKDGKVLIPAGEYVTHERAALIDKSGVEEVLARSPLACRALEGICAACYGFDLGNNLEVELGEAVGIVAAQAIGEPGTQLTMRTFHTGGVAGGGDITSGLPRVEEIFEVRSPRGKALLCDVEGEVAEITEEDREKIIKVRVSGPAKIQEASPSDKTKKKQKGLLAKLTRVMPLLGEGEIKEFRVPLRAGLWVNPGQKLNKGDLLSEGHADLRELFKLAGKERVEKYIIQEVQKIYSLHGAPIHDKHIEIIVRQMFSRVRIKDRGDTNLSLDEIVDKRLLRRANRAVLQSNQKPAKAAQLIMGISRVALTTASFLSAASFQETARVLIDTAIRGRKDELRGLKENVIIGRLIPAGTGYRLLK